jgi:MerR family transcriptional regulator, light-induced transcriptional regulator
MESEIGHLIKIASRRSGLSPHVIRVWEKRYGAVAPSRTPTNRRLYTDADIERLQLLHQAISSGYSIGRIANLPAAELASLSDFQRVGHSAEKSVESPTPGGISEESDISPPISDVEWQGSENCVESCIEALRRFDAIDIERQLARASVHLDQLQLFAAVIEPLMHRIGALWRDGHLRIADEHLASAVVRSFVDSMRAAFPASPASPHIVVTTPSGQLHEIGALMVSSQAAREGWQVTYLGPNLPAQEIARAAQQKRVLAVGLSLVYPEDDPHLGGELVRLKRCLPKDIALLVGGRAAFGYRDLLERIGATHLPDLSTLRTELEKLRTPREIDYEAA